MQLCKNDNAKRRCAFIQHIWHSTTNKYQRSLSTCAENSSSSEKLQVLCFDISDMVSKIKGKEGYKTMDVTESKDQELNQAASCPAIRTGPLRVSIRMPGYYKEARSFPSSEHKCNRSL